MRIADLIRFGMPKRILDLWRESGLEYLLPIQVEAIQSHDLLDGKSLLINAPTSSGKSFCGEMAAIRAINNNQKAIILEPLKAIATEKYFELRKKYRKAGFRIIALSSDYPEHDSAFIKGNYNLAIAVYEKLNALTANDIRPIENLGAIVMDELQLAASGDRGLAYELAIAKILLLSKSIQKIGLIGGLDNCDEFCRWFDCGVLKSANRPVELYRGVLLDGKFHYRRFNDCREGIEYFVSDKTILPNLSAQNIPIDLIQAIKYLTDKNEQAMLFVATRNSCVKMALGLAEILGLSPSQKTLESLEIIPDTLQKANLIACLKGGVGFHNADLGHSTRQLLEDGFRDGDIKIIVATSTLALGVNFPSKNVFMESIKFYDGRDGKPVQRPLLPCDYNQIAGRAGRLGHTNDFGRAIFIASDDSSREILWDSYIYGIAKTEIGSFEMEQWARILLHGIACGVVRDQNDADSFFQSTFRGRLGLVKSDLIPAAIKILLDSGFLELKGYRLYCTSFGKATAVHNIDLNTSLQIKTGFAKYHLGDNRISWLYYLLNTPAGLRQKLGGNRYAFSFVDYPVELAQILEYFGEYPIGPFAELPEHIDIHEDSERLDKLITLVSLAMEMPTIRIEQFKNIGYGRILELGKEIANVIRAVAEIGYPSYLPKLDQKSKLENFADCLYWGVPQTGLFLARLKSPYLERDFILKLNQAGLFTSSDIINAGFDIVAALIPQVVAEKLMLYCQNQLAMESRDKDNRRAAIRKPLLAKKVGERFEVVINGFTIKLQPRLFAYLSKLYNCDHPEGWLDKSFLDSGTNQIKYIYCLKNALSSVPGALIESDGAGRYRLILPECVYKTGPISEKYPLAADSGG
jgi:helicase